jgi:hypothetical protein
MGASGLQKNCKLVKKSTLFAEAGSARDLQEQMCAALLLATLNTLRIIIIIIIFVDVMRFQSLQVGLLSCKGTRGCPSLLVYEMCVSTGTDRMIQVMSSQNLKMSSKKIFEKMLGGYVPHRYALMF